jgi:hypothetical protein
MPDTISERLTSTTVQSRGHAAVHVLAGVEIPGAQDFWLLARTQRGVASCAVE